MIASRTLKKSLGCRPALIYLWIKGLKNVADQGADMESAPTGLELDPLPSLPTL